MEKLIRAVALLQEALEDIAAMQPLWHGGVGRVPYHSLQGLVEQMRETASEALKQCG